MMADLFAVRNLRLCTKDCLCLYVCPTGASDTENSIIDRKKMYRLWAMRSRLSLRRDLDGSGRNAAPAAQGHRGCRCVCG